MDTRQQVIKFIGVSFLMFPLSVSVNAADWPRWRGPNGDGISAETEWEPVALARGPKILWKADIGSGYSNVVIKDDSLYTMGKLKGKPSVFCFNAETGKIIWQYAFIGSRDPQSTPALDGGFIHALSAEGELFCLVARNGEQQWKKNLVEEFHGERPFHYFSTSPVVDGNLIIINVNKYGAAFDKKTSMLLWISQPTKGLDINQYSTAVLGDVNGRRCAIIFGNHIVSAVEINSGKLLWSVPVESVPGEYCIPDPICFNGKMFVSMYSPSSEHSSCLWNVQKNSPTILWQNKNMGNDISSSVLVDGFIYGIDGKSDGGHNSLRCIDWDAGKLMWEKKMRMASLIAADGKLIIIDEKGALSIVKAAPSGYEEIAKCAIPDQKKYEQWWTPPVLWGGKLYCRGNLGDLVCIDLSK
jgi:outer membrane protein assembly factor BamB